MDRNVTMPPPRPKILKDKPLTAGSRVLVTKTTVTKRGQKKVSVKTAVPQSASSTLDLPNQAKKQRTSQSPGPSFEEDFIVPELEEKPANSTRRGKVRLVFTALLEFP